MKFPPIQYNFVMDTLRPKVTELRDAWKTCEDDETREQLGIQLSIAQRALDTIEEFYQEFAF
jgi:hypothetical protein